MKDILRAEDNILADLDIALARLRKAQSERDEALAACKAALSVGEIAFGTCALSRDVGAKIRAAIANAEGQ
jgi:hypothetical protein